MTRERVCPSCGDTTTEQPYCLECKAWYARLRRAGRLDEWRARMAKSPWRAKVTLDTEALERDFTRYYEERRAGKPPTETLARMAFRYGCSPRTTQARFWRWLERTGRESLAGTRKGLGLSKAALRKPRKRTKHEKWSPRVQRLAAQRVHELQQDGNAANSEIAEIAQELNVAVRTLYHWRDKYFPRYPRPTKEHGDHHDG